MFDSAITVLLSLMGVLVVMLVGISLYGIFNPKRDLIDDLIKWKDKRKESKK